MMMSTQLLFCWVTESKQLPFGQVTMSTEFQFNQVSAHRVSVTGFR